MYATIATTTRSKALLYYRYLRIKYGSDMRDALQVSAVLLPLLIIAKLIEIYAWS